MQRRILMTAGLLFCALLGSACSSRQMYFSGQQTRQAECNQQADMAARQRCLAQANMPYEDYRKEVDGKPAEQTKKGS